MDERDRRFYSWLAIVFGPLFILGGFAAAFTAPGAMFVWFGVTMLGAGIALRTPFPVIAVASGAAVLLTLLVAYTAFVYP